MPYDIDAVRTEFRALSVTDSGQPRIYLDAPGGTQVCRRAVARMVDYMERGTANDGGYFRTSRDTETVCEAAHEAVADLFGGKRSEVAFGANMTSLVFACSRALARQWQAGDEIVLTRMDHDANVAPWLHIARDLGLTVRWLDFDLTNWGYRLETLPALLNGRTKLVAVNYASNALGTINDVAEITRIVRANCNALVHVDAVQAMPHLPIDVAAIGADIVVASPYKFFGPHQGVLWGREDLLADLDVYKVRPATDTPAAAKLETGTPSYEAQAGTLGAVEHIAWIGETMAGANGGRREALRAGMALIADYEAGLGAQMLAGLQTVRGLTLHGLPTMEGRVPTFAITIDGHASDDIARALAAENIFVWSGSFYAKEVLDRLNLPDGLVRLGPCHYNTAAEVDRTVAVLRRIAA